ncbi:MAG: hypothetical protein ACOZAM_29865 [Pseudomonadota bacterium]
MTRKRPAGTCIGHAVASLRHNIAYAFRINWPWYLIVIPLTVAVSLVPSHAANWLITIFGITVLTSLHGFFVERRDF